MIENKNEIDIEIKKELMNLFPEGLVRGVQKYKDLENLINRRRNRLKLSKKEYFNKLGFKFAEDRGIEFSENNIEKYLEKYFPEKIIYGITSLHDRKQNLYLAIMDECNKKNIEIIDYLHNKGYEVVKNNKISDKTGNLINLSSSLLFSDNIKSNKYNIKAITNLLENYNCSKADLAKVFKCRRQQIDNLLSSISGKDNFLGEKLQFEDEIQNKILELLEDLQTEYISEQIYIKIYFGLKDNNVAILYKYKDEIKHMFNPGGIIGETLSKLSYGKYKELDIKLLRELKLEYAFINKIKRWDGSETKIRIENDKLKENINKNRKKHNMSLKE